MYRNPANAPDPSCESPAFEGITRLRTNEPQGDPAGIDVAGTVEPNKISGTTEDLKQPKTRQSKQNALNIQTEYGIIQYHGPRNKTTHLVPTGKTQPSEGQARGISANADTTSLVRPVSTRNNPFSYAKKGQTILQKKLKTP